MVPLSDVTETTAITLTCTHWYSSGQKGVKFLLKLGWMGKTRYSLKLSLTKTQQSIEWIIMPLILVLGQVCWSSWMLSVSVLQLGSAGWAWDGPWAKRRAEGFWFSFGFSFWVWGTKVWSCTSGDPSGADLLHSNAHGPSPVMGEDYWVEDDPGLYIVFLCCLAAAFPHQKLKITWHSWRTSCLLCSFSSIKWE